MYQRWGLTSKALEINLRPEGGGGGVKVDFPVFTYLIRAAGDEQEEKTGPKSDLAF